MVVDRDADSDADTVVQSASHLDQMQVETEVGVPSPSCSAEFMPESPLGEAYATDVDVVVAGIDAAAACVGAELVVADGRELQHCPTAKVVYAAVNIVSIPARVGVNVLGVGMEAAAEGSLALDMSVDGGLPELDHAGPPAANGAMDADTTDVESGSGASCASDTGGSDGDAVLSDAVTAILDCSSSMDVAGDGIAAAAVLDDVPVPRQWRDAAGDAVEDLDDRVPPSKLDVTWSWLMEEE
ncbi:MAG: hypothetical protein WBQ21_11940 [Solirubrobacteraceae bacterium]